MNEFVQTWWQPVSSLAAIIAAAAALWVRNTAKAENAEAIQSLKDRQDEHDERLTRLEAAFENMPQRSDFQKLGDHLHELAGDMKAQTAELHGMKDVLRATQISVQRVNDFLLNEKNR